MGEASARACCGDIGAIEFGRRSRSLAALYHVKCAEGVRARQSASLRAVRFRRLLESAAIGECDNLAPCPVPSRITGQDNQPSGSIQVLERDMLHDASVRGRHQWSKPVIVKSSGERKGSVYVRLAIAMAFTIGLAVGVFRIAGVVGAERANSTVGVGARWMALMQRDEAANQTGVRAALEDARASGLTTVVIPLLETVQELETSGRLAVYERQRGAAFTRSELGVLPESATTVIVAAEDYSLDPVIQALQTRYGGSLVSTQTIAWEDRQAQVVYGSWSSSPRATRVRYDSWKWAAAAVQQAGLSVVLEVPGGTYAEGAMLVDLVKEACSAGRVDGLLIRGPVPFAVDSSDGEALLSVLRENRVPLLSQEVLSPVDARETQTGLRDYAEILEWNTLRTHVLPATANPQRDIPVRALRAVRERNIRFLLLERVDGGSREDLLELAASLPERLAPDFKVGIPVGGFEIDNAGLADRLLMVLACALLPLVFAWRYKVSGFTAVIVGLLGVGAVLSPWRLIMDAWLLMTAVGIAVLAVLAPTPARAVRPLIWGYLSGLAIVLIGGLLIHALGSTEARMLGFDRFRGFKVLLLAPGFLLTGVAVWSLRQHLAHIRLRRAVSRALVAAGVLALVAALYVYIVRSGNSGYMPQFEGRIRDALDAMLPIRPRFKEFLVGFPALLLAVRARRSPEGLLVGAVATVGTAGALTSFVHYHTPPTLSLLRTLMSGVAGLGFGLLLVLAAQRLSSPPGRSSAP